MRNWIDFKAELQILERCMPTSNCLPEREQIREIRQRFAAEKCQTDCQEDSRKTVYLMRGLPSCGKSTRAKELVQASGIVLETDAYFEHIGEDGVTLYDYDSKQLGEARSWLMTRFQEALEKGISPIVIDRGNGVNRESRAFAQKAQEFGYAVQISEPNSPWWAEIRTLLRYRPLTDSLLEAWAEELAELSRETHSVSAETIRHWMECWQDDVSVDDILTA